MANNKRFEKRFEDLAPSISKKLRQIDELKGQWIAGAQLSSQVLGRLKRSVLLTSTGASTRIEGSKLSDEEIERLMKGLSVKKFIDRDSQEVRGYYELLENVFDSWKRTRLNESTIKSFHKELLKYTNKDIRHRGDYKKGENVVQMVDAQGKQIAVLFETVPAYLTPKAMQELVEWTQHAFDEGMYHPLLIIANFLVEFLYIHPFQDGNGRLSRILTNLLLLKEGYGYAPYVSHEKLIEDNKAEYYLALRKSQKTVKGARANITPWLDFFFAMVLKHSQVAVDLLSQENIEKILSPKQLSVWSYLQSVEQTTPREIVLHTKIARPTVNQALEVLLRLKKIERMGLGRSTRYKARIA